MFRRFYNELMYLAINGNKLILIPPCLLLIPILYIIAHTIYNYYNQKSTIQWDPIPCVITYKFHDPSKSSAYYSGRGYKIPLGNQEVNDLARYTYNVNGATYQSSRILFADLINANRYDLRIFLDQSRISSSTIAFFNPNDPSSSVLVNRVDPIVFSAIKNFIVDFVMLFMISLCISIIFWKVQLFGKSRPV